MITTQQRLTIQDRKKARQRIVKAADGEFGVCALCGFTHLHPLERWVCPECGRPVCWGMNGVCECGGEPSRA